MSAQHKLDFDRTSHKYILGNVNISKLPERIQRRIVLQPCQINGLTGDCWNWTGFRYQGYGRLSLKGFKTEKAHRIIYGLLRQPIPDDLETDHLCLNRSCVNPDHLEPVTRLENIRRSHVTGTGNGTKTHCPSGHEYTPENIYLWRGKRICRTCGGYKRGAA